MSSIARRIPAATCTVSAPNCLITRALTTSPFSRCATPRRTAARLANIGDVSQEHRHVAASGDDGLSEIVDRLCASESPYGPFDRALRDDATRRVVIRLFHGVHDLIEADAPRRHPFRIELDLELSEIAAEPLDCGDAWHREQAIVDLELGKVAQGHQVGGARFCFERKLEDLVQPPGQARDQRRSVPGGSWAAT